MLFSKRNLLALKLLCTLLKLILLCLFSLSISIVPSTAWLCWVLLNESHTKVQWAKVFRVLFWEQWSVHNNFLNTFQEQNWVVVENGTVISKFLLLFYYGFREMQIKTTVRYHRTPVRTAVIKKSTNNKSCVWRKGKVWRGCGEKGMLLHCWWECELIQPL